MGDLPPLIGNPYFMGIHQPLRTWVDEFIPYYYDFDSPADTGKYQKDKITKKNKKKQIKKTLQKNKNQKKNKKNKKTQ